MSDLDQPPSADPREDEILCAAYEVFTEKGFHGATMLEVAKRARASKATLYARFQNKEKLFYALLDWGCRQTMAELQAITEDLSRSPEQALADYASKVLQTICSPGAQALLRISIAEGARHPEVGRIYSSLTREPAIRMTQRLIWRLQQAGTIVVDDPVEFGRSFIGLLRGDVFYQALLGVAPPPPPEDLDRLARQSVARLLRAFGPEK